MWSNFYFVVVIIFFVLVSFIYIKSTQHDKTSDSEKMMLFSLLSLCVATTNASRLFNVHLLNGNGTHYGNPFDGPCQSDEKVIKDKGGSIVCPLLTLVYVSLPMRCAYFYFRISQCAAQCGLGHPKCPTDKPATM